MSSTAAARPLVLASAGVGVVGVTFGMARYGVGLLAPDIRATFSLSSAALGVLAASSYVAYLATTVAAGVLGDRLGARLVVGIGGACAVAGMVGAALAPTPGLLFAALLVAGASAGLAFPPFASVVAQVLRPAQRPPVVAAISAGTGWGVALAVPVALLAGSDWRAAWLAYAALAAAATAWALVVLPPAAAPRASTVALRPSWLVCPRSGPLLGGALLVGLASSAYWTFGVDRVTAAGLSTTQGRLFLAAVGVASVAGTLGAAAIRRVGARATFTAAAATEAGALALLGLAPSSLVAAFASAVLFGAAYNVIVSVALIWSGRVFAQRPAAGSAAVLVMNALGLLVGPPLLGLAADLAGFGAVFCGTGVVALLAGALAPREPLAPPGLAR